MSLLPLIAPISYVPHLNVFMYMSMMLLSLGDNGGWLTPINAVDHSNGSWSFVTSSPHFNPSQQLSVTLEGDFDQPLEVEYLFSISTNSSWEKLIDFDERLTQQLNETLHHRLSKKQLDLFGGPTPLKLEDKPEFTDEVTLLDYFTENFTNVGNWPKQFLSLLQVFTWSVGENNSEFIGALTPSFLHFKTNLYNLNRQLIL